MTIYIIKKLIAMLVSLAAAGSVFFHFTENWTWLDSIYFTIMTITTVGHTDLAIVSAASKIVTSIIAIAGIALVFMLFGILSYHWVKKEGPR